MRFSWKASLGLAATLALALVPATAMATTHDEPICPGTGATFRACVNDTFAMQGQQIASLKHRVHVLEHKVGFLADYTFTNVKALQHSIASLEATDATQSSTVEKLDAAYRCQFGNLLNVTTTLVTNTDGNNVEALILNHHGLSPAWAVVFNGCH